MAGLERYESVYRGRPAKSWDAGVPYPEKYYGREVIRPLDVPVVHPLAEDNPPNVEDGESVCKLRRCFVMQNDDSYTYFRPILFLFIHAYTLLNTFGTVYLRNYQQFAYTNMYITSLSKYSYVFTTTSISLK